MSSYRPAHTLVVAEPYTAAELPGFGEYLLRHHHTLRQDTKLLFRSALEKISKEDSAAERLTPTTVINCGSAQIDSASLRSIVTEFEKDNEYSEQFLQVVILSVSGDSNESIVLNSEVQTLLQSWGCGVCFVTTIPLDVDLPDGPYFYHQGALYWQWRLYDDVYNAFQVASVQNAYDKFSYKTFSRINIDGHLKIAVPSRLHYKRDALRPLNGMRVAVKDIFDISGLKTSGQSRSYYNLYPPRNKTASSIQTLLQLGAIVVGKAKGTQFASSEQPTADWIETLCPFNPRGDGLLNPRGSSTGSGVAVAGYDWLDFAIGSDTSGSMRGPASVMGMFGNRPTFGLLEMDGVLPCSSLLDTAAFAARDIETFHTINTAWYKLPNGTPSAFRPRRLLYLNDYLPFDNPVAQKLDDAFVDLMARFLGIKPQRINLAAQWDEHNPTGDRTPLSEYVAPIMNTLIWSGYYHNYLQFRKDYQETFAATPYVDPVIRFAWERGAKITDKEIADVKHRKATYKKWMEDKVLCNREGELDVILMYPVGDPEHAYRDNYRPPPDKLTGYNWRDKEDHQACLAGLPAFNIPIGQTSYESKVTGNTEWIPVSIAIMGPRSECPSTSARLSND